MKTDIAIAILLLAIFTLSFVILYMWFSPTDTVMTDALLYMELMAP